MFASWLCPTISKMTTTPGVSIKRSLRHDGLLLLRCFWGAQLIAASPVAAQSPKWNAGHYVFVNTAPINPKEHLLEHFQGVQKCYGWWALETAEGRYDFSAIKKDAPLVKAHGKHRLYPKMSGVVPLGAAVQSPDYSVANKLRTAAFDRVADRASVKVTPQDEMPIPVEEHLKLAQEKLKLNYLFWSLSPRRCFENVKTLLAKPELASDPAGGLDTRLPTKAFLK